LNLLRGFLLAVAAALVVTAVAVGLAFDAGFQTWAAQRALARRSALGTSVGAVSCGLDGVSLRDVRIEQRGAVCTFPEVEAELPVLSAGFRHAVLIRRLVARGWVLDLRGVPGGRLESAAVAVPVVVLQGLLDRLRLPVDFALDGLDAEGDVIVPAAPGRAGGRAHVRLSGGGLAAGQEGRFTFTLQFAPAAADAPVNSIEADGTLSAAMGGPRAFRRLDLRVDATATGPRLPRTVRIAADLRAARDAAGETYALNLVGNNKELVSLQAGVPDERGRLAGTWKLDVCDDDLTPFMFGRPLPVFDGVGAGRFDADVRWSEIHARGVLDLTADRLGVLRPQLADVGPVRLTAAFDLTRRDGTLRVDHLQAALAGSQPILTVTGLQAFAFNPGTGELTVADAAHDLFRVALHDVPVAWGQPWLRRVVLTGGSLRGELVAGARDGGLRLSSSRPLTLAHLSATREGSPLLQDAGMSFVSTASYTPQGWQVEVESQGAAPPSPYHLEARLGRLAGPDQPVKLTGRLGVDLPAALPGSRLTGGSLVCDFAASLAARREVELKLAVSGLAGRDGAGELPGVTANIRADFDPAGRIVFHAPLRINRDDRQTDLTVAGTVTSTAGEVAVDGQVSSDRIHPEDARILAAAFFIHPPFWRRVTGRLALALKDVSAPQFAATDVTGVLRFAPDLLRFDGLHASLGDTGDATVSGACRFDGTALEPWSLDADVTVGNFNPAPVFRARYPGRLPTIEGKFNVTGHVTGRGRDPADAVARTHGDLRFESNGGVLRILAENVSSKEASTRKAAIIGSFIGDLASAVTGRRDLGAEFTEVAGKLSTLPYDQMSLVLSRDASLNTTLRDFALISPELRLEGGGRVTYAAATPLLEQPLSAEFKLGARGHTADLFKTVGMLGTQADDLGYYPFLEPLTVAGTLGEPDTSALQAALLKDLYKTSGASDLFDKLLGK